MDAHLTNHSRAIPKLVQLDNQLPVPLTETIFIPKEMYHRVIKGTGDLTVKIKKLND